MSLPNRWLILALVSIALFLIVVDATVLYTALPRLTHDLGASAAEKLWIINAYPLVVAGLLPGAGTLGDRIGHKPLFLAGLVVFGMASLVAAYSPTPEILIGSRALLAIGAALMMPATLSIIRHTFEDEAERGFAIGIWAAIASGAAAMGPVLGGALMEYFWWGSVFLINVPIILITLPLAFFFIPNRPGEQGHRWDLTASLLIMAGLIGVVYAIKELGHPGPSYQTIAIAAVVGLGFLGLFVRRQQRAAAPLIDFSLFRDTHFSSGVAAALAASIALIGMQLGLTQRLQLVMGLSPLMAGLFTLPIPIASFLAGPLAGWMIGRFGAGRIIWGSLVLAGIGSGSILLTYGGPNIALLVSLFIYGGGLGASITAASSTIMHYAPASRAGMAASIEEVSYELGAVLGVAIMGSLLSAVYTATLILPPGTVFPDSVFDSLDDALIAAEKMAPDAAAKLTALARAAFDHGFTMICGLATGLLFITAAAIAYADRWAEKRGAITQTP